MSNLLSLRWLSLFFVVCKEETSSFMQLGSIHERKIKGTNASNGDSLPAWSATHNKEFYTYLSCLEIVMSLGVIRLFRI